MADALIHDSQVLDGTCNICKQAADLTVHWTAAQPLQLAEWQLAPHQVEQEPGKQAAASSTAVKQAYSNFEELERTKAQLPPDVDASFATILATLNSSRVSSPSIWAVY